MVWVTLRIAAKFYEETMTELKAKTVNESAIDEHVYRVFPNDLNANNTVFGGLIMSTLDRVCSVVAEKHSGILCVTASVDSMHFLSPGRGGEILVFMASVNRSWNSSMEIGAKVVAHNYRTGEKRNIVSAFYTFVAVDKDQRPVPVPKVIPETPKQKARYEAAEHRREVRKKEAALKKRALK
jgi:acyl-CoA hydrolase